MTRYRVSTWFPEEPDKKNTRVFQLRCRICAICKANGTARTYQQSRRKPTGSAKWKLERLDSGALQWVIEYTSDMPKIVVGKRHACQ